MRRDRPLVSVIIPYYRHGRHLHQAVNSALRAYSGPKEVLIINDGSIETKAELYINNATALDPAVRVIAQPNGGLSSARNTGIHAARGDFIQFLDSDDLITPGKIDLQVEAFHTCPRYDIMITNYALCDEAATQFIREGDSITQYSFSLRDFLYQWERGFSIPIHCGLFRRSALQSVLFDTAVAGKEDWIFWCQQAFAGRSFGYLPVCGAIYRQHRDGMSKSFRVMGENWLRAAERIRDALDLRDPEFEVEVQAWYRTFYEPRIAQEAAQIEPTRTSTNSAYQAYTATDTTWNEHLTLPTGSPTSSPLFSIIIPVYNHYDHLHACLETVAMQRPPGGVEVILADDCSSDPRIRPLLERFARAMPNVRLLHNDSNLGISATQNIAVEAARGEFVAFVDCDDALEPNALSVMSQFIEPSVDYLFSDRTDVDQNDNFIRVARYGGYNWLTRSGDIRRDLLSGMVASHLKVIRRSAYRSAGGCDPAYAGVQDWDLALKIADTGGSFVYIPKALYRHRIHTDSVTGSEVVRQTWLSNIVRRRFATRWLSRSILDQDAKRRAAQTCADLVQGRPANVTDVLIIREIKIPHSLAVLRKAWRDRRVCIYAPRPEATIPDMNFVREYNSYFDGILANDEAVACFFVGYMWDHTMLHFAGERSMLPRVT